MLRVATVSCSFSDDIVFENPSLVLYAVGCKWACPGCHNKSLQCFELNDDNTGLHEEAIIEIIKAKSEFLKKVSCHDLTVVGSGGDFFFQLEDWLALVHKIKLLCPYVKIIWYTGADFSEEGGEDKCRLKEIDAILWGRLRNSDGLVVKQLSLAKDGHATITDVIIGQYRPEFEDKNLQEIKKC